MANIITFNPNFKKETTTTEIITPNRVTGIMFDSRKSPTDLAGINVRGSMTVDEALNASGLNWRVEQHLLRDAQTNSVIPGFKVNVRTYDNAPLGIVSDRYKICQNIDAFDFVNHIVKDGNIELETAGMVGDGKKVWMEAKMPEMNIIGEPTTPYILFVNTHDGTGAVRVCFTTLRIWCKNMLSLGIRRAERAFSFQHKGDMAAKLVEARETLVGADEYFTELSTEIEGLAMQKMDINQVETAVKLLFPIKEGEESQRKINNAENDRAEFLYRYRNADDLNNIRGTAYGFLSAASDFASHATPHRLTSNYYGNNLMRLVSGSSIVDTAYSIVKAA